MDFELSEEHRMIIDGAKKFAEKELAPLAAEYDEKQETNIAALKELGELGYLGMTVPDQYGGTGVGAVAYAGAMVEFSKVDAGVSVGVSVQNSLVNDAIMMFGTEDQKKFYLPKLASGEWLGCFSLTEAGAGSDPGHIRATAVRDGNDVILNGTKNFTTNGGFADVIIAFFSTDKDKGAKGISAFLISKDTPGFEVGKHENKLGIRSSSTTELVFTDCRVPAGSLLGQENKGLSIALATLDCGRIGIAAQAIGIAEAALEEAVKYSKERIQFGKPLAEFEALQFTLADMAVDVEVAKTMLYRVAWMKDSGAKRFTKESAMVKLFASEMAHRVCHKALQIHGGYGFIKDYKVERLYRDQRITEIYEGTSEIQRLVIARYLLSD
ncbi:MAG: acyl-CoA dehydrogenase [Candidatus Aminicenantes bacterium RBG_16_63_14]|nr:MAG: acyl-CoA dehydrogenase [Candidatus Aminicenantes bacterium RBG_16_63_14]OGD29197.1 MAG: acyl-CoA dehydrogenase [Candidatus Aminicenantes bacterium RBG_19FT_COMBO_65_30]